MDKKKVLGIGAGITGIISIAHLKAEGFEPICYERSNWYGGTWHYRKETQYGQASIMPTTVINHSKEMGAFSNFPPRKEFNNYMRHFELYQYFKDYVKHFDCEKCIQYNMEVLHVQKSKDYNTTGKWVIETKNRISGETKQEIFDAVFLCTGHINMPYMPVYPGQGRFKGKILHTHSLKEVDEFNGQTVVVVGMGCSALDAAVEISRVAKQVYLSTRSGSFIWNRVGRNGNPIDSMLLRRCFTFLLDILPTHLISWYLETFYSDTIFYHGLYYKKPKYHIMSKEPAINDHIGSKLLSGLVIQKSDMINFTDDAVLFENDIEYIKVDAIVMGTGYTWGFPFLDDDILIKEGNRINLYKLMYPPHLSHPSLVFLGFANPYGPGFPIIELQVRWAVYLLTGKGYLPTKEEMMKDIIKHYEANTKRYSPSKQMSIRVDFVQYMDEIAEQFGVKPNLLKYLFTDFPLFLKLVFGPAVSYQYRLEGHGKWEGAREAIMTVESRMQWPLTKENAVNKGILRYILEYLINMIPLNVQIWG